MPIACNDSSRSIIFIVPYCLSSELVPRRISSNNTIQRSRFRAAIICSIRFISAKKYDLPSLNESDNRIDTNSGSGCTSAFLAQTGNPSCVSSIFIPNVRRKVLLPDIFEPVRSTKCASSNTISLVTRSLSGIRGCPTASKLTL